MSRMNPKLDDIYGVKSERSFFKKMPDGTTSDWVSNRRYHNHFRGYTEIRHVDEYGRSHIERVYTSPWTVMDVSDGKYWAVRIAFILLALVSAALFIIAMAQDIPGNKHWTVAIPGFPTIVFLILLFVRVGGFCAVPRKMTLWDFESSSKRLRRMTLIAMCFELVTGLALIVFALVTQQEVGRTLLSGFLDVLAAVCTGAIWFIEKRLPYKEVPNETPVPAGESYPIR